MAMYIKNQDERYLFKLNIIFQCMNHEPSMTVLSIVLILRCYIMYNAKHIESDQVSPT